MCSFLLSLCIELMRASSSILAQNKVVKITTWSGEDFSYHDDCGNCAQGLTPHLLLAVNLSHFPILDLSSFFFFLFFSTRADLVCTRNLVLRAFFKKLKGLRALWGGQLLFVYMKLLLLLSSQVWRAQWPSEGRMWWCSEERLLQAFWYAAYSHIVCCRRRLLFTAMVHA